jgi:hypothetical protein
MNGKYRIRAIKFGNGWKPRFTRPEGHVINGRVILAEAEYPSYNSFFETEEEANTATYDFLMGEKVNPENIEIVLNIN